MQQYEDEITYNNRFSPKNAAANGQKLLKKKAPGQSQPPQSNEDWSSSVNVSMINRQGSKKGIGLVGTNGGVTEFMSKKFPGQPGAGMSQGGH